MLQLSARVGCWDYIAVGVSAPYGLQGFMFRRRASLRFNFRAFFEASSLARGPQIDLGARGEIFSLKCRSYGLAMLGRFSSSGGTYGADDYGEN